MARLRKQYLSRPMGQDRWIWDVHHLLRQAAPLPVLDVAVADIAELQENWWFPNPDDLPTPEALVAHMRLVQAADLRYPILLCAEGRLMDGMHRVCKALLTGQATLPARRFGVTPEPDFLNVDIAKLPYPDEEV